MDYKEKIVVLLNSQELSKEQKEKLEEIFPELKESEDEQIRKELLEHCINRRDGKQVCVDANDYRRWADWLEKQGQPKKTSIWKHWKDGIAGNGDGIPVFLIKNGLTYSLSPCLSFECDYIELSELDSFMLEKQGKQKPQGKTALEAIKKEYNTIDPHPFKAEHFYVSKVDGKIHDMTYNPADKVEPKFKNGQWVVWQDKCYKVNYNGCGYELVDQNGFSTSLEYGTIDENAHLWTIQDAKDGDVLAYRGEQWIFIYKERKDETLIEYYALASEKGLTINDVALTVLVSCIVPATKAQCDTLMKAMADAGYEWDADKKELKKIEQKPAFEMKTPEESLGIDSDTYNKIVDECIYGEQKPAWSEEDEVGLADAMWAIEQARTIAKDENDMGNLWYAEHWLKSLKDRLQLK